MSEDTSEGAVAMPTFSVVLCVNRTNPHLREAILSVLNQTHRDFEFLIGANACPDSLIEELNAIVGFDDRVAIHRTELPQLAFSLNNLVERATGDWIVRMDADDVCEPSRIEQTAHEIKGGDFDVLGSWAILIDANGRKVGKFEPFTSDEKIKRSFPFRSQLCHPTVAFRRSFWLEMRGYLGGQVSEDYDLWLRAMNAGAKFANIPKHLLRYRMHSGQVSRSRLGYAEVAGYWYRELLYRPNWRNFCGSVVSTAKLLLRGWKTKR